MGNKKVKSLIIKDSKDNPKHRQTIGFFKHTADKMGVTRIELLHILKDKSLNQVFHELKVNQSNNKENKSTD